MQNFSAESTREPTSKDTLFTMEYLSVVREFMKITQTNFKLTDIIPVFRKLLTSKYVEQLSLDPDNLNLQNCISRRLELEPNVPSQFLHRLLAIFRMKIVCRSSTLDDTVSVTVDIDFSKLEPTTKMTKLTTDTRFKSLCDDINESASPMENVERIVPNTVNVPLTPKWMESINEIQSGLEDWVREGNRLNGYSMEEYMKSIQL